MIYPKVRELRESRGMTQKDVAKALDCSQQVYSNYELGQRDLPTKILVGLALFYDVSVDYILGLTSNPNRN